MSYAEGIKEFVDRSNSVLLPDFYKLPIAQQREMYLGLTKEFHYDLPEGITITDDTISHEGRTISIRVYRPKQVKGNGLLIYIRGGGFVIGSLESHNSAVSELCDKTGLVTVGPDFRMSPEHPFPASLEDCYGALCGLSREAERFGIDPSRIVISGDSSGANMAVAVCMMSRDRGGPKLRGQALICPVLDFTRWRNGGVDAPLLTGGEMEFFTACYAPETDQVKHQYVSPLISGSFNGLPPAYIMGASMDSLVTDSEQYARLLKENDTPVEFVIEPGLVHAPIRARALSPVVAEAWERLCNRAARLAGVEEGRL